MAEINGHFDNIVCKLSLTCQFPFLGFPIFDAEPPLSLRPECCRYLPTQTLFNNDIWDIFQPPEKMEK